MQRQVFDPKRIAEGMALQLRATDVVITPFGKSGTTWTQQIVHTLRTGGDMDFDDISRVIPWIEMSPLLGLDLDAEQRSHPRAFKSHLSWHDVPKGGRYINVMRAPGDVLVSNFRFMEGWFFEAGSIEIDEYARETFFKSRGYFAHLKSWWPRRNDPDVLFLAYERMLQESTRTIRRIADFIGISLDEALLATTEAHSSIDFMLEHKDRFDDAMLRGRLERGGALPPGSDSAKVRQGQSGEASRLPETIRAELDTLWREEMLESTGCARYEDLLNALESD
ncbi:MAG: sulfotransferase domain-containing protein [Myxococcota bacterium]